MACSLLRRLGSRFRSCFHSQADHLSAKSYENRRRFRGLLLESLEMRALMAANPVAQDDRAYYTPINTDRSS